MNYIFKTNTGHWLFFSIKLICHFKIKCKTKSKPPLEPFILLPPIGPSLPPLPPFRRRPFSAAGRMRRRGKRWPATSRWSWQKSRPRSSSTAPETTSCATKTPTWPTSWRVSWTSASWGRRWEGQRSKVNSGQVRLWQAKHFRVPCNFWS